MNDLEIAYNNKLVALFDGLQGKAALGGGALVFDVPNYYPFCQMDDEQNTGCIDCTALELDYHTRFDWLMPVVAKINRFDILAEWVPEGVEATFYVLKQMLQKALLKGEIENVYLVVVRIIKFINSLEGQKLVA